MLHMICDFCGKCCDSEAIMITLTPIHNHMNKHNSENNLILDKKSNFLCCQICYSKQLKLPNPYEKYYKTCNESEISINKTISNYTDSDFIEDDNKKL